MRQIKEPPFLPSVICILNPDDAYYLKEYEQQPDIDYKSILTPYDVQQMQIHGVDFSGVAIHENSILMRDCGQRKYIVRTPLTDSNSVEKRGHCVEQIVSYLGGIDFTWGESSIKDINGKVLVGVKEGAFAKEPGSRKVVSYDHSVGVDTGLDLKKKKQLQSSASFYGGKYTVEGYNRAVEIAKETGLYQSDDIRSLLEERNPNHPNPLKRKAYQVDVVSDLKANVDVATKMQASIGKILGANLDVNVDAAFRDGSSHSVVFEATFGPVEKKKNVLLYAIATVLGVGFFVLIALLITGVL